jgi:hypothetical protein
MILDRRNPAAGCSANSAAPPRCSIRW